MLQKGADCRTTAIDFEVYKNRVTIHVCAIASISQWQNFYEKNAEPSYQKLYGCRIKFLCDDRNLDGAPGRFRFG